MPDIEIENTAVVPVGSDLKSELKVAPEKSEGSQLQSNDDSHEKSKDDVGVKPEAAKEQTVDKVKEEAAKEGISDFGNEGSKDNSNRSDLKYRNNPNFHMYLSKKLSIKGAEKLAALCETLLLTNDDFDERAVELLANFSPDQIDFILDQLLESQMFGVHNKSQYLMSVMRNFKDRVRSLGPEVAINMPLILGPSVENIKKILDRTGYQLEVTVGQRKYHNAPNSDGVDHSVDSSSSRACIYIGQIPNFLYEDTLIPLFEKIGKIYDLRLMMDPVNGNSRGYAFCNYFQKEHAIEGAKQYDGFEISPGKCLKVNISVANQRLFIGNIPKSKTKDEILSELQKGIEGITDVIIYANVISGDIRKNRGFCFVDFCDHKTASDAKRRISQGKMRPWNNDLVVDWAEQQDEPDEKTMSTVKVLYVKNVKDAVSEETLEEMFKKHGQVERTKKIRDYAFIHFKEREGALAAMNAMKGTMLEGVELDISLAKPQGDMNQKKKIAMKRGDRGGFELGGSVRGARYSQQEYYPSSPMNAPRRSHGSNYQKFTEQPKQQYGEYYGVDPYSGGYGPACGGVNAYAQDSYYGAPSNYALDPYYGFASAPYSPARGGYFEGGLSRGSGGMARMTRSAGAGRGGGFRGGGRASRRGGAKRSADEFGGPNAKRGGGMENDFTYDMPMNTF